MPGDPTYCPPASSWTLFLFLNLHWAPPLQSGLSGLVSFLLQAEPPPLPLGLLGGANPPPARWPFDTGSELQPQKPTPRVSTPQGGIIPNGFSSHTGQGASFQQSPSAPKAHLLLSFYGSTRLGPRPPYHEAVCSLVSGPSPLSRLQVSASATSCPTTH